MFLFYNHKDTPFFFTYRLTGRLITRNYLRQDSGKLVKKNTFFLFFCYKKYSFTFTFLKTNLHYHNKT